MSYEKQTWTNGDVITAEKLNHMEDGIAGAGGGILKIDTSDFTPIVINGDEYTSVTIRVDGGDTTLENCYIYDIDSSFGNVPVYLNDGGLCLPVGYGTLEATAVDASEGARITSDTTIAAIYDNGDEFYFFPSDATFAVGMNQLTI